MPDVRATIVMFWASVSLRSISVLLVLVELAEVDGIEPNRSPVFQASTGASGLHVTCAQFRIGLSPDEDFHCLVVDTHVARFPRLVVLLSNRSPSGRAQPSRYLALSASDILSNAWVSRNSRASASMVKETSWPLSTTTFLSRSSGTRKNSFRKFTRLIRES